MARSKDFRELLVERLKNPKEATFYFNAILDECKDCDEEEAKQLISAALNDIADAQSNASLTTITQHHKK
jgi:DNA-binding phage protein